MADQYVAASESIVLAATTILTPLVVELTASTRRISLNEIGVSFNGVSSSAVPVIVRLVRVSTVPVTFPAITQAATPMDPSAPASLCTAYMPAVATGAFGTAPTIGVTLRTWFVSPTSGLVIQFPLGQEPDSPPTAANGLAIGCLAPASVSVNSYMVWTE